MTTDRDVTPEVIARQTQPFNRNEMPDRLDEIRDELLTDLRDEVLRAHWGTDYTVQLIVGDADLSSNTVVLRAEAVRAKPPLRRCRHNGGTDDCPPSCLLVHGDRFARVREDQP